MIFYSDSNDTDYKSCSGNESDTRKNALKQNGSNPRPTPQEKDQNFEIPNDLLGEFTALKKATNLDTASLMRKLIHDYAQSSGCEKNTSGSRLTSQLFDVSIQSSEKDKTGLINYYDEDRPVSPGEIIRSDIKKQRTFETTPNDIPVRKAVEVQRNPSPARIYSAEPYYWSDENYEPPYSGESTFSNGYTNSMKVPTVVREQDSDSSCESPSFVENNRPNSRQSMYAQSIGSEGSGRNVISEPNVEYTYVNESLKSKSQDPYATATPMMEDGSVSSAFPLVASLCDENGVIISPKHDDDVLERENKIEDMKFSQEIISHTDAHMAMQALNPHGITAKLHKASGKNNSKKGQMKLIAENTSHHGVYTSVLKLPWSRRTVLQKRPCTGSKNPDKAKKQLVSCDNFIPPDIEELHESGLSPIPIKMEPVDEEGSETPGTPQLQQPVMLMPVPGIPSSQNGIFVPANNMPLYSEAHNNQPMMMVYPNASFMNLERPTRKRGRPPKVPVLARMLSDTSKVPRFDFPVTNFFPQFTPCQQPAIVLNVNNMMNTGNVANATNNTSANVNTTTANNVVENTVEQRGQSNEQENANKEEANATDMISSEAMTLNVPIQAQVYNVTNGNSKEMTDIYSMAEQKVKETFASKTVKENFASKTSMTTTTSIANVQSGAIYQEMILSSKTLVNVRPRKRQSTTELLKSKSTPTNDFICTSFKLRNVNKQEKEKKKTPWIPGMKRRGRPPKKKLFSMMEGEVESILHPDNFMPATIHHFPPGVVASTVQPPEVYSPGMTAGQHTITPQISPISVASTPQQRNEMDVNGSPTPTDGSSTNDDNKQTDDEKEENGKDMFQQLFHCKICNEIVPVEKREEHRERHVQMKYCCNKCESKRHENKLHLRCIFEGCNEKFFNHASLKEHIQTKHYSVKRYTCSKPGCDEDFTSERDLKFHLLLHNDSDMCTYECEICDYRCHQQHVLEWHMKNLHPETVSKDDDGGSKNENQDN
ncbi:unnamed protein product [Mytilus coruscus]|uniref:C2H2-type domain-containing protein n=1 Tax=Mytilus coruscus TaxID=42192 RepID=A0A6J8ECJ3_MYTCO|nr:unnamed protein product [Mytilus coruscus]